MAKRQRQKFSRIIHNNALMIGKIARFTPLYFVFMVLEGLIQGAINSAAALFNYELLNACNNNVGYGS